MQYRAKKIKNQLVNNVKAMTESEGQRCTDKDEG